MTATVTAPVPQQQELLDDVHAEESLRAFSYRNFGRMCALCAHWTIYLLAAQQRATPAGMEWRLSSWVTSCCSANHALESMSDDTLAGRLFKVSGDEARWRPFVEAELQMIGGQIRDAGAAPLNPQPSLGEA